MSPDGKYVAAKLLDLKTIYVWDVGRGELVYRLQHATAPSSRFAFTPDGKYLYTGDRFPYQEQLIRDAHGRSISDAHGNERVRELKPEERFTAHLWDVETGNKVRTFFYGKDNQNVCWYTGTQFRADGKQFAEGGNKGIYLCDVETARPIKFIPYPWMVNDQWKEAQRRGVPYLADADGFVVLPGWKVALIAANRVFPKLNKDERWESEVVLVWMDLDSGRMFREVAVTPRSQGAVHIQSLSVSSDSEFVAVATNYGGGTIFPDGAAFINREPIRVYRTDSGAQISELELKDAAWGMSFSRDGSLLFSSGQKLAVWEMPSGRKVGEFSHRSRHIMYVDISADGRTFVGGVEDRIYVWSVKNNERRSIH